MIESSGMSVGEVKSLVDSSQNLAALVGPSSENKRKRVEASRIARLRTFVFLSIEVSQNPENTLNTGEPIGKARRKA
jgi:hypothetical protein